MMTPNGLPHQPRGGRRSPGSCGSDLGRLILCDFIDMRMEKHRRVERAPRASKKHKERAKCLRMSHFGVSR
jgi:Ribonuclease G/E